MGSTRSHGGGGAKFSESTRAGTEIDLHEKSGGVPDTDPHPRKGGVPDTDPHPRKKKTFEGSRNSEAKPQFKFGHRDGVTSESYRATGVAIHASG
jgi:hypothetical protein